MLKLMKKKAIIITTIILSLILIGGGAFAFYRHNNSKNEAVVATDEAQVDDSITEETADDEDYTKVVINPVDNIAANQDAQEVSSADQLVSCGYTRQTTEGPYYISGTSQLTNGNLNYDNLSGTPLVIAGYVYGG